MQASGSPPALHGTALPADVRGQSGPALYPAARELPAPHAALGPSLDRAVDSYTAARNYAMSDAAATLPGAPPSPSIPHAVIVPARTGSALQSSDSVPCVLARLCFYPGGI